MEYPEPLPPNSYRYAPSVFTFGTQVAQVLVDIETGQVTIEKLVAVQDAGQVINPGGARGQMEGGVTMGLGYALMEELLVDQGNTHNPNLGTYLIPTARDVPALTVKLIEIPEPYAPFGAKGLGRASAYAHCSCHLECSLGCDRHSLIPNPTYPRAGFNCHRICA